MKLGRPTERKRALRTTDLIGREEAPTPTFSAQAVLESYAEALRGDVGITSFGRSDGAAIQAKLSLLIPDRAAYVYDHPAEPFPQRVNDTRGQGHNLLLYARQFPHVPETLSKIYSVENLREFAVAAFEPGTRPELWPKLIGKLLYPEAGGWGLKDTEKTYVLSWIQGLMEHNPTWTDERKALSVGAELVLLDPGVKSTLQHVFKRVLSEFQRKAGNIFGTASEVLDLAYDLEIVFGETLSLDERGALQTNAGAVSAQRPLPERLTA